MTLAGGIADLRTAMVLTHPDRQCVEGLQGQMLWWSLWRGRIPMIINCIPFRIGGKVNDSEEGDYKSRDKDCSDNSKSFGFRHSGTNLTVQPRKGRGSEDNPNHWMTRQWIWKYASTKGGRGALLSPRYKMRDGWRQEVKLEGIWCILKRWAIAWSTLMQERMEKPSLCAVGVVSQGIELLVIEEQADGALEMPAVVANDRSLDKTQMQTIARPNLLKFSELAI